LKLGKKTRQSSKGNYYIISPRVIITAIIIKVKTHAQVQRSGVAIQQKLND